MEKYLHNSSIFSLLAYLWSGDLAVLHFCIKCSNPMLAGPVRISTKLPPNCVRKLSQRPPCLSQHLNPLLLRRVMSEFGTLPDGNFLWGFLMCSWINLIVCKKYVQLWCQKAKYWKRENIKQVYFIVFCTTLCSFSFPKCQQQFGSSLWYCQKAKIYISDLFITFAKIWLKSGQHFNKWNLS